MLTTIHGTIIPVGPRQKAADQYYALLITVSQDKNTPTATELPPFPWKWEWAPPENLTLRLAYELDDGALIVQVPDIPVEKLGGQAANEPALTKLKEELERDIWDKTSGTNGKLFYDDSDHSTPKLAAALLHLSTFSGDMPQQLRLRFHFKLPAGPAVPDWTKLKRFSVAPIFNYDGSKFLPSPTSLDEWTYTIGGAPAPTDMVKAQVDFLTVQLPVPADPATWYETDFGKTNGIPNPSPEPCLADYWFRSSKAVSTTGRHFHKNDETSDNDKKQIPDGWSLKIDRKEPKDPSEDDEADPLDYNISGAGLLVARKRRSETTWSAWCILNAAGIRLAQGADTLFSNPVLVPVRLPYFGEGDKPIREGRVSYNQASLIVGSLLHQAHEGYLDGKRTDGVLDALYQYFLNLPAPNGLSPLDVYRIPRMGFGDEFLAALFVMDHAGGLPRLLQARDAGAVPWHFDETYIPLLKAKDLFIDGTTALKDAYEFPDQTTLRIKGVFNHILYPRDVAVGQIRVVGEKFKGAVSPQEFDKDPNVFLPPEVPEIPPGIRPLARDLPKLASGTNTAGAAPPLVLLKDGQAGRDVPQFKSEFKFKVCAPSVEIETFERWWGDEHKEILCSLRKDYEVKSSQEWRFLEFDDPAVVGMAAKLEVWKGPDTRIEKVETVYWPDILPAEIVEKNQTHLTHVEVCVAPFNLTVPTSDRLKVEIPSSDGAPCAYVARLSLYALVPKAFVKGSVGPEVRFPERFFNEYTGSLVDQDNNDLSDTYFVLSPWTILFEVPNNTMPIPKDLWNALQLTVREDRTIDVSISPVAVTMDNYYNVVGFDVIRQEWRWQGRPVPPLVKCLPTDAQGGAAPCSTTLDQNDAILKWETAAFLEMNDVLDSETVRVAYHVASPDPIFRLPLDADPRSHYFRFAIRAYSRYASLFDDLKPLESKQHYKDAIFEGYGWKRAFLPYAGRPAVKPVTRAFIPLTSESSGSAACDPRAPYLVVIDGASFETCGITEALECRVEQVEVPATPEFILNEIGPDPALTKEIDPDNKLVIDGHGALVIGGPPAPPSATKFRQRLEGPFGHTFDTDARTSRYFASGYLLAPLAAPPLSAPFADTYRTFVKIRVRRLSGNPNIDKISENEDDAWTTSLWILFQQSSTFERLADGNIEGAFFSSDRAVQLTKNARVRTDERSGTDASPFYYYMLLTNKIVDFRGGLHDAEAFQELRRVKIEANGTSFRTIDNLKFLDAKKPKYGRLVEIESPTNFSRGLAPNDRELLKRLFGNPTPNSAAEAAKDDADARVVRVWPRFLIRPAQ